MTTTIREFITPHFTTLDPLSQYHEIMKAVSEYAVLWNARQEHFADTSTSYNPEVEQRVVDFYGRLCNSVYQLAATANRVLR